MSCPSCWGVHTDPQTAIACYDKGKADRKPDVVSPVARPTAAQDDVLTTPAARATTPGRRATAPGYAVTEHFQTSTSKTRIHPNLPDPGRTLRGLGR